MSQLISKPSAASTAQEVSIHIILNKSISIQGVTAIIESDENTIALTLSDSTLVLSGEKFNIDTFDVSKNYTLISGKLCALKCCGGRQKLSFLKRIIK